VLRGKGSHGKAFDDPIKNLTGTFFGKRRRQNLLAIDAGNQQVQISIGKLKRLARSGRGANDNVLELTSGFSWNAFVYHGGASGTSSPH